jgi:hypothetical protein
MERQNKTDQTKTGSDIQCKDLSDAVICTAKEVRLHHIMKIKCSLKNPICGSDSYVPVLKHRLKTVLKRLNMHAFRSSSKCYTRFCANIKLL